MDAVKFLKEQARMCRANDNCSTCPLKEEHLGTFCTNISDDALINRKIDIVERWAKEHPAKTRLSELQKIFPKVIVREDGLPIVCPSHLDAEWDCIENCSECKRKYWLEEIE